MALDAVKNFSKAIVSTGYDDVATEIVLNSGEGAKFPEPSEDGEFNVVWWNSTDYADPADDPSVEIVRVTARSTDTLTVTRAQESTSATTKNTSGKTYKIMLCFTALMIQNIGTNFLAKDGTTTGATSQAQVFTNGINLGAGTDSNAPLKLTSGINLTAAEAGAFEFDGMSLYFTPSTTRKTISFVGDNISTFINDSGYLTSAANTSLSNLASVAINTSLISDTDSTDDLGSSDKYWANAYIDKVYLNATATIDGALAGNLQIVGNIIPATTDTVALGSATKMMSDLFLADGGVINFDNGDLTLTHSSNLLKIAGGNLEINNNNINVGSAVGDKASIKLNSSALNDESWSGTIVSGTAGEALAVGDVCFLNSSGKWVLNDGILDGTDTGFKSELGICVLAASGDAEPVNILVNGLIASAAFPAFTTGAPVYLDDTAGDLVVTQPSTSNFAIRIVGYALSSTILHFNPSNDYIVHT